MPIAVPNGMLKRDKQDKIIPKIACKRTLDTVFFIIAPGAGAHIWAF